MPEELSFGTWLRQRRRTLDLTQKALAEQVGCAEITVRRMEADAYKPSNELAIVLFEKLGVSESERPQWVAFARGMSELPAKQIVKPNKPKSNLPASLTSFIGREREQADVISLLAKYRLVTLTGPGGIGKTRLSIKVGEYTLMDYADGVWLVELASIFDPLLVTRIIAISIGLQDEPQRPVIDMLSDYLRTRQMLIILDNCEHLLDACAQLTNTLLKRCPNLKILATSREVLGVLGETIYPVSSLQLPDMQQLLENIRDYESVRLFEERAQLARTDFLLTIENATSVAEICSRLDGIPLAIELAAAWVNVFSVEQIAVHLQESIGLLTTMNRTALPRHQTLEAAIDWSYDLLSPTEQALFQRLSIFVSGWTLEAAESICSDTNIKIEIILDLLAQLINKSLVIVRKIQRETRYYMLDTIRQYANGKLVDAGESKLLCDRHLEYFLHLAEMAEPHLIRPEQLEWLAKLEVDYENLRAAFELGLRKESAELALRMCGALGMYWVIRGRWLEGTKWLAESLGKPANEMNQVEKTARVRVLYKDAELANNLDEIERMENSAVMSLALAQSGPDRLDVAIARLFVGHYLYHQHKYRESRRLVEQSYHEFRALDMPYWISYSFYILGNILNILGEQPFIDLGLQTVDLARKSGERLLLARSLYMLSSAYYFSSKLDESFRYAQEADMYFRQVGSFNLTTFLFGDLAWLSGDFERAKLLYTELQERLTLLGERRIRSRILGYLGLLAQEQGYLDQAKAYFEERLEIARENNDLENTAYSLVTLSNTVYLNGDKEKGRRYFSEGVRIVKSLSTVFRKKNLLLYSLNSICGYDPKSTACILGILDRADKEAIHPIAPLERREYEHTEAYIRKVLGNDAFKSAFAEGQNMSLDDALDLVMKLVETM